MTSNAPDPAASGDAASPPVTEVSTTRSEERLDVVTRRRAVARARLVGYVETETVTRTVQVHRDQVRLEFEPLAADGRHPSPTGDGEAWVVLYDEEIVVTTRRVPRERVRMRVRSVTTEREITETIAREQIDVDETGRGPGGSTSH
jgi:uncharacterized protein (TIGR02271 family)